MSILLPQDNHWLTSNWVSRGLFEDLRDLVTVGHAELSEKISFCVDAEVETLDLESAPDDQLSALLDAVRQALAHWRARGGQGFARPDSYPVYIGKLSELEGLLVVCLAARMESDAAGVVADHDPDGFPLGSTVNDGAIVVSEHLFGQGLNQAFLGVSMDEELARFLISTCMAQTQTVRELAAKLDYSAAGVLDLEYLGPFDQGEHCADGHIDERVLVERLPDGDCARRAIRTALGHIEAVSLTLMTGKILQRAAESGVLLVRLRPETIWIGSKDGRRTITGLSDRGPRFFLSAKVPCTFSPPTYERLYSAPEVLSGRGRSDSSLSFTLAVLLAEWATGVYPFPDSWSTGGAASLYAGKYAALNLAPGLEVVVGAALQADPNKRPRLASFLDSIGELGADDLVQPSRF